jgi:hypothetical protein
MSLAEYRERFGQIGKAGQAKAKRASKFNNSSITIDGFNFQSKKEGRRYQTLKVMLEAGQITDLRMQVSYVLNEAVKYAGEKRKTPTMKYIADFVYTDVATGQIVVEDVKSAVTRKLRPYRMKKHFMFTVHGIEIKEV